MSSSTANAARIDSFRLDHNTYVDCMSLFI